MSVFLFLTGMLIGVAGIVLLIWATISKKWPISRCFIVFGVGLIIFVIGVAIHPSEGKPTVTPPPVSSPSPSPPVSLVPVGPPEQKRTRSVGECVEPANPLVRNTAASTIQDAPKGVAVNSEAWKIWRINYWVANNISYISDPKGYEYFASASETLKVKAGDCDDFAVLLASLYESVGLDATIASIDTNMDSRVDHMSCLVFYPSTADSFMGQIKDLMSKLMVSSPTGEIHIKYLDATKSKLLPKYDRGIWVFADPPMAEVKDMVGYITHEAWEITSITDVGS